MREDERAAKCLLKRSELSCSGWFANKMPNYETLGCGAGPLCACLADLVEYQSATGTEGLRLLLRLILERGQQTYRLQTAKNSFSLEAAIPRIDLKVHWQRRAERLSSDVS